MPGGSEGADEHLVTSAITEVLATHADKFPGLAAAMATVGGSQNQGLEFGLSRILDGLVVLISQR